MDLVAPIIDNGDLYIKDTHQGRYLQSSCNALGAVDFIDEFNLLYKVVQYFGKLGYLQYEDIDNVKDLMGHSDDQFKEIRLVAGIGKTKFEKIECDGYIIVAIDENGNLWTNSISEIVLYQITKDMPMQSTYLSSTDIDGNVYLYSNKDVKRLDMQGLKFIQCFLCDKSVYLLDETTNLWYSGDYTFEAFKIIKTDVISFVESDEFIGKRWNSDKKFDLPEYFRGCS